MITRRKLLTNGVPAVAAFVAVGVVAATPQQDSLEELLAWAASVGLYMEICADGSTRVQCRFGEDDQIDLLNGEFADLCGADTLREALEKAKKEIEHSHSGGTP